MNLEDEMFKAVFAAHLEADAVWEVQRRRVFTPAEDEGFRRAVRAHRSAGFASARGEHAARARVEVR